MAMQFVIEIFIEPFSAEEECAAAQQGAYLVHLRLLAGRGEEARHSGGAALPVLGCCLDLLAADAAQRIKLGPAIGFRHPPLRLDPATRLETQQRGIDGALVEAESVSTDL